MSNRREMFLYDPVRHKSYAVNSDEALAAGFSRCEEGEVSLYTSGECTKVNSKEYKDAKLHVTKTGSTFVHQDDEWKEACTANAGNLKCCTKKDTVPSPETGACIKVKGPSFQRQNLQVSDGMYGVRYIATKDSPAMSNLPEPSYFTNTYVPSIKGVPSGVARSEEKGTLPASSLMRLRKTSDSIPDNYGNLLTQAPPQKRGTPRRKQRRSTPKRAAPKQAPKPLLTPAGVLEEALGFSPSRSWQTPEISDEQVMAPPSPLLPFDIQGTPAASSDSDVFQELFGGSPAIAGSPALSRNPSSSSLTRRAVAGSSELPPGYLDIYAAAPESMADYQPVSAGSPAGSPGSARSATPGGSLVRRPSGRRFSIRSSTSDNSSTTTSLQRTASSTRAAEQLADVASSLLRQPSDSASLKSNGNQGSPVGSPVDWNKTTVFSGPPVRGPASELLTSNAGSPARTTSSAMESPAGVTRTASVTSGASLGRTASVTSNGSRGRAIMFQSPSENEVPFSPAAVENVITGSPLAAFGVSSGSGSPRAGDNLPPALNYFEAYQKINGMPQDRLDSIFKTLSTAISFGTTQPLISESLRSQSINLAEGYVPLQEAIRGAYNKHSKDGNVRAALLLLQEGLTPASQEQLQAFLQTLDTQINCSNYKFKKSCPKDTCVWDYATGCVKKISPLESAGVPRALRTGLHPKK